MADITAAMVKGGADSLRLQVEQLIGADGQLVGYGGGLPLKKALLNFEATVHDFGPQPFSLVPA